MRQVLFSILLIITLFDANAQGSRLLRDADISNDKIVFAYGSDLWIVSKDGGKAIRLTSTQAVESSPKFSPDGKTIAFTSNRSGSNQVYTLPIVGGTPTQLTWHPKGAITRGWSPDGTSILYASSRGTAPARYNRLWTITPNGGVPKMLSKQWANDGSYAPKGDKIVIDRVARWDVEWRGYRGGQNTPLIIQNTTTHEETLLPNKKTTDIKPVWIDNKIYFLSDRDLVMNIWSYDVNTAQLDQLTKFTGSDIKSLEGHDNTLIYERNGYIHLYDLKSGNSKQVNVSVRGDFPWAETKWENVSKSIQSASLSPNGKRVILYSRGDIFTVPVKNGDSRNITSSSNAADRAPIWSPKGDKIAWFSDKNKKYYELIIADQDGTSSLQTLPIRESKMAWNPTWSPDGKYITFVDDDVRLRLINLATKTIKTIDTGGTNLERGQTKMTWSPDSKWITYTKAGPNNFRRIYIYSITENKTRPVTDPFADSFSPTWDLNHKQLYFLASTDLALGSGWANTSSMTADPVYAAYVINLDNDEESPFKPKSDEEEIEKQEGKKVEKDKTDKEKKEKKYVKIDFDGIKRRVMALSIPARAYRYTVQGPEGSVFIAENIPNKGTTLHKFELDKDKTTEFLTDVQSVDVTPNGKHMLVLQKKSWKSTNTDGAKGDGKDIKIDLQIKLDRSAEWQQIFEEAWRYERDYFYDPNHHDRDWQVVYDRYAPLIPHVKHRADLTYILDQLNGELSVGHSFVFGGDYPKTERTKVGLLGADLSTQNGRWKIDRVLTTESWNPGLSGPLDAPGLKVSNGNYIVGINGKELKGTDNIYKYLDGTVNKQTTLHVSNTPSFVGSWKIIVKPIQSESSLRQRTWVEDNRRLVDKLSNGRLAYIWVPNTANAGLESFNRYYFAQQDKDGAVIDERFNGGGFLDDYMVDLMSRKLRASLTNEVPNGKPMKLPAGILGPKALVINELAGSGGDFFPWVFRKQNIGKLIGTTTWGGLVKSSVHYLLVDGGALTAPDNAVFDPVKAEWVGENVGIHPDIEVRQDAISIESGKDPQLERAVKELMRDLKPIKVKLPKYPKHATGNKN